MEREIHEDDLRTVMGFAERILECPMEVIDGVAGDAGVSGGAARSDPVHEGACGRTEAEDRPLRAGRLLPHTAIVKEKDAAAYRALVAERGMDRARHVDDRQQSRSRT